MSICSRKACIYCGATNDLSDSDVIPDALTNAKIINPNVCRIEHNSKFSDLFESKVIKELALITNELDVKSSKGKKYATYDAKIVVDGVEYVTRLSSEAELFKGKKILSTEDKTHKLGPIEQIGKIKDAADENMSMVDINQMEIEKRVTLKIEVFFSIEMHRLVTKIAFEWYCLHNEVQGKIDSFDSIIEFISLGQGKNPVEFVSNKDFYGLINSLDEIGGHTLLTYIAEDNSVNVIVSLFGIAIYNVRILDAPIEQCRNNAIFQKVTIDAKRYQFCFETLDGLIGTFSDAFYDVALSDGVIVKFPKNMLDLSLEYQIMYASNYRMFQNGLACINSPNPSALDLLETQISRVLQESTLTVRGLKRFVKEHKDYLEHGDSLNPQGTNKKSIFLFYMLFIVGKSEGKIQNIHDLYTAVKQKFLSDSILLSDEVSNSLRDEILSTDGYFDIIKSGALSVELWPFD